jgi:hypothetical protein
MILTFQYTKMERGTPSIITVTVTDKAPYILRDYIQLTHLLFYRKKNTYQFNLAADTGLASRVDISLGESIQKRVESYTERPNAFLGEPYQLRGLRSMIRRVLENMDERI